MKPSRGLQTNGVNRNNLGITADWVYTPRASTVFDVDAGANNFQEGQYPDTRSRLATRPSTSDCPPTWMQRPARSTRFRSCRSRV